MKKLFILLLLILVAGALMAQNYVLPVDPNILGKGNATIAEPNDFASFFYNPAGFAKNKGFNLINATPWIFTDMATINLLTNPEEFASGIETQMADTDVQADIVDWFADQTTESLALVLLDAGYSELDIITAGGPSTFFENLTEDEILSIIGVVIAQEDFPISAATLGLPSGAARVGMHNGIYFVGGQIGLGVFSALELELEGDNILTAAGGINETISFHVGLGLTIIDTDLLKLYVGGQIRTFIGVNASISIDTIKLFMGGENEPLEILNDINGIRYAGFGLDAGAILELGWFNFGLSVFDVPATLTVYEEAIIASILADAEFLVGASEYKQPMRLNFGVGFHPEIPIISGLLNPTLYIDFQDLVSVIVAAKEADVYGLIDLINIGAEVTLLSFINARAGFTNGYYTVGAGINLGFIQINAATIFGALELEDVSDFGVTFELALRI